MIKIIDLDIIYVYNLFFFYVLFNYIANLLKFLIINIYKNLFLYYLYILIINNNY